MWTFTALSIRTTQICVFFHSLIYAESFAVDLLFEWICSHGMLDASSRKSQTPQVSQVHWDSRLPFASTNVVHLRCARLACSLKGIGWRSTYVSIGRHLIQVSEISFLLDREAAAQNADHFRALKLLGSATVRTGRLPRAPAMNCRLPCSCSQTIQMPCVISAAPSVRLVRHRTQAERSGMLWLQIQTIWRYAGSHLKCYICLSICSLLDHIHAEECEMGAGIAVELLLVPCAPILRQPCGIFIACLSIS